MNSDSMRQWRKTHGSELDEITDFISSVQPVHYVMNYVGLDGTIEMKRSKPTLTALGKTLDVSGWRTFLQQYRTVDISV